MVFNPWRITRAMFLEEHEVESLLARLSARVRQAPPDDPTSRVDELIVRALLFSGLRNSEFCQLKVADTIVGTGKSVFLVRGTPREDRTVHVPQVLSDLVRRFVADIRPLSLPAGVSPRDPKLPLVLNERGKPYERTGLYRRVVRILSEANLARRASVQLLRHTYGYLAYKRSGGNLLFVQRQLGHAHPMVTSVYAEFVNEPYDKMADAVGTPPANDVHRETARRRAVRKPRGRVKRDL
ncbi:MAG: site-specific integrase [Planctomycetia bacterium]|nr:site-specific integrase [Planctomycetia bacterium]